MLSSAGIRTLASACLEFAKNASDSKGCVDIRRLCEEFGAELIVRPLLVEGMIGRRQESDHAWTVLIDSETYPGTTPSTVSIR